MPAKKQRLARERAGLQIRVFFRRYPALPYLLKWLCISAGIGVCAGSASAGFLQSLDWATGYRESHPWLIVLLPLAGLATGLLYHYWGAGIEQGNNLLMETIRNPRQAIPLRMAPFVYIGTVATHLFGGSAGREGTALQMAVAIADRFSKPLRLNRDERQTLLIAAVAAGFGSVFGTPLAGAVFGLEAAIAGRLKHTAVFPAFAAAIIADLVAVLWHTRHPHYHTGPVPDVSVSNIACAAVAGLAFGLCAALFGKATRLAGSVFKSAIAFPPFRPMAGGAVVAIAVWAAGTTKYIGLGVPTIVLSFGQQLPAQDFALKMAFTAVTLGAGFKGGEATPLFFMGAALGSALSCLIPLPTGLLSGMGFAAVFAAATNTPLAGIVMAVELFGGGCGVYAAIACTTACLLSGHEGGYGRQIMGEPEHAGFAGRNADEP